MISHKRMVSFHFQSALYLAKLRIAFNRSATIIYFISGRLRFGTKHIHLRLRISVAYCRCIILHSFMAFLRVGNHWVYGYTFRPTDMIYRLLWRYSLNRSIICLLFRIISYNEGREKQAVNIKLCPILNACKTACVWLLCDYHINSTPMVSSPMIISLITKMDHAWITIFVLL